LGESLSRFAGFAYAGLIVWLVAITLTSTDFRRVAGSWYAIGAGTATAVAALTGWTNLDLSYYYAVWGRTVAAHGIGKLYELSYAPVDYPPLYPALLSVAAFCERWLHIAGTHRLAPFVFKLPPLLALLMLPIIAGAAIDVAGISLAGRWGVALVAATLLNPALLFVSVVWGQADVVVADLVLLAGIALCRNRAAAAGALWMAALLVKLQAIFALPALGAVIVVRRKERAVIGAAVALAAMLPATFAHGGLFAGFVWLAHVYRGLSNDYDWITLSAGTLPALMSGLGQNSDGAAGLLGISWFHLSIGAEVIVASAVAASIWRERDCLTNARLFWYVAVSQLVVYFVATRMHERYVLYAYVTTLVWAFIRRNVAAAMSAGFLTLAVLTEFVAGRYVDILLGINVGFSLFGAVPGAMLTETYGVLTLLGVVSLLLSGCEGAPQPRPLLFAKAVP
jgi:Gpi18-like mannosyltransferase